MNEIQLTNITHLHDYHAYKIFGERNPNFDHVSRKLLDLKEKDCRKHKDAVKFFAKSLCEYVKSKNNQEVIQICIVPSSSADKVSFGLESVVSILCAEFPNLIANPKALNRKKTIEKLATGGDRSQSVHYNSIEVSQDFNNGIKCVLIDDIYTTGNSLRACETILRNSGAVVLELIALSKTV